MRGHQHLNDIFGLAVSAHRDRIALVAEHSSWSYGDLHGAVVSLGARFAREIGTSKRVGLLFQSGEAHVRAYLALLQSGNVPFLIDPSSDGRALRDIALSVGLDTLLDGRNPDTAPHVDCDLIGVRLPELAPDTVLCRFTSGSRGAPKCLEFRASAVTAAATTWASASGLQAKDAVLCVTPFSNGLAFNTSLLSAFLVGATLIVCPAGPVTRRNLDERLERFGATRLIGFPSLFRRMLITGNSRRADKLVSIISAAATMEPELRNKVSESFGASVYDYYGVAEVGPVTSGGGPNVPGAMGLLLPGAAIRSVERNGSCVLAVKTEWMATRYLNAPGEFEGRINKGFFATGDVGYVEDGQVYLTGRADRLVKVGGRTVNQAVIEAAAREVPNVFDAVACTMLSSKGETMIRLDIASPFVDQKQLRIALQNKLPAYMVPSRIVVHKELRRNAVGKLLAITDEDT